MVFVGVIMIIVAVSNHGRGYSFEEIPDVFFKVLGRYLN